MVSDFKLVFGMGSSFLSFQEETDGSAADTLRRTAEIKVSKHRLRQETSFHGSTLLRPVMGLGGEHALRVDWHESPFVRHSFVPEAFTMELPPAHFLNREIKNWQKDINHLIG